MIIWPELLVSYYVVYCGFLTGAPALASARCSCTVVLGHVYLRSKDRWCPSDCRQSSIHCYLLTRKVILWRRVLGCCWIYLDLFKSWEKVHVSHPLGKYYFTFPRILKEKLSDYVIYCIYSIYIYILKDQVSLKKGTRIGKLTFQLFQVRINKK